MCWRRRLSNSRCAFLRLYVFEYSFLAMCVCLDGSAGSTQDLHAQLLLHTHLLSGGCWMEPAERAAFGVTVFLVYTEGSDKLKLHVWFDSCSGKIKPDPLNHSKHAFSETFLISFQPKNFRCIVFFVLFCFFYF